MRLTAVIPDRTVIVDGIALTVEHLPDLGGATALQWDSGALHGIIQDGSQNGPFKDPAVAEPFIHAWQLALREKHTAIDDAHLKSIGANERHQVEQKQLAEERAAAAAAEVAAEQRRQAEQDARLAAIKAAGEQAEAEALAVEAANRRAHADISAR